MPTVNEISLIIRDLEYDPCKREAQLGTGCDGKCVACHRRVFDEMATRLRNAFETDKEQVDGTARSAAMDAVVEQVGDWAYAQCVMATRIFGEDYVDGCSETCDACHRMICNEMANRVLRAWVEAFPREGSEADDTNDMGMDSVPDASPSGGAGEADRRGIIIDGRPDARDRLGYVVAWERDVDGLTVRDPRDVATVRFDALGAFPTYEAARAFIGFVRETYGSGRGWVESLRNA